MKTTLTLPPPQPRPNGTVKIEMDEREAHILFGIVADLTGEQVMEMLGNNLFWSELDLSSIRVQQCRSFIFSLFDSLRESFPETNEN